MQMRPRQLDACWDAIIVGAASISFLDLLAPATEEGVTPARWEQYYYDYDCTIDWDAL